MEMSKSPAPFVPVWARDFYNDWRYPSRPRAVSIDDETPPDLPHRRAAFYALLCSDRSDMREFWVRAECLIRKECEQRGFPVEPELRHFLGRLILARDSAIDPEPYSFSRYIPPKLPRLRQPLQNLARKVACQIAELALITPRRRISGEPLPTPWPGELVESMVIFYDFLMPETSYYWIFSKNEIEFTATSKRGWIQHAQAAERLRPKAVTNLRCLAAKSPDDLDFMRDRLLAYAKALESVPTLEELERDEPELESQKATWADWLRTLQAWYAVDGELGIVDALPKSDWVTLVSVLFGAEVTDRYIRMILDK